MVKRLAESGIRFLSKAASKGNGTERGSQSNSWLRQRLIDLGQRRHVVGTRIWYECRALFGVVSPAEVTPLSEDEAVRAAKKFLWRSLIFTGVAAFLNEQRRGMLYIRESEKRRKIIEEFLERQSLLGLPGVTPESSENQLSGQESWMEKIQAKVRQK